MFNSTCLLQYFFDATEAESWMSEQELYMMSEDKGKDEISAQNLMKKHATFENEIDNFHETVMQLGDVSKQLSNANHPLR